jgi:iron complex outermembrane receptor protein
MTRLFLFVGILLFSTSSLFARHFQENNGIIKGTVTTSDGKPAAGVTITIKGLRQTAVTDENGSFILRNIAAGSYEIDLTFTGYAPLVQTVTVEDNKTTAINLQLKLTQQQLQEVVVTGMVKKYAIDSSDYVAKIPLKNLENPQVYNVIGKALIKDQQVTDFQTALLNVPGGVPMQNPDRSIFIMLRGFEAYGNIRNGIATGAAVFNNVDPVNIERIEVLKGPSSTLFGSSITSYGGTVNRVTKKPYEGFGGGVGYTGGQYNVSRLTLDINTPLNNDRTALLRVNAATDREGSFTDVGDQKKWIVAPSFSYKVNSRLTFNLDAEIAYNNATALIEGGQGLDNLSAVKYNQIHLPYNSALTGHDLRNRVGNSSVFAEAGYLLSDNWTSQTAYSYSVQNMDEYNMVFTSFENDSLLSRDVYALRGGKYTGLDIQQNIIGSLHTGTIRHRIVLGLDYYNSNIISASNFVPYDADLDFTQPGTANMTTERLSDTIAQYGLSNNYYNQNVYAAYASDVINFTDKLIGMASLRLDHFVATGEGGYKQTALSPKFGLIYQVVKDQVSLFANYMNGFQNQSGFDFNEKSFKPQHANQWEGGVKLDIVKGKLSSTLSYYNILVENILISDNDHPGYQIQGGSQRSKGFEAEFIASPTAGLSFVAGYGYNDNAYVATEDYLKGKRPVESPANTFNGWASYTVPKGNLQGLGIGFGGNYVSEMFGYFDSDNHTALPAYTTLYATLSYNQPKYSIGLRMNNITNKEYWNTNLQAQMLRQVTGTISYKF